VQMRHCLLSLIDGVNGPSNSQEAQGNSPQGAWAFQDQVSNSITSINP
jgi:hypothetical protein